MSNDENESGTIETTNKAAVLSGTTVAALASATNAATGEDRVITCRCGNPLNTVAALEAMFLRTDIKPGHNSWVRCNRCGVNLARRGHGDYVYPPRKVQKSLDRSVRRGTGAPGPSTHKSAIAELRRMR